MSDDKTLVERLRDYGDGEYVQNHYDRIEAADLIEALSAEIARLTETVRRVQAAARTLETTRCEIYQHYVENSKINAAAVSTLDSEREANALLTADIERKDTEIARLRTALEHIIPLLRATNSLQENGFADDSVNIARAALGGNDE